MTDTETRYIISDEPADTSTDDPTVYLSVGSPYTDHAEELTELAPRHDLREYADEFEWGVNTDGTKQLAVAILATLYDEETALEYHCEFAQRALAGVTAGRGLSIPIRSIDRVVDQLKNPTVDSVKVADEPTEDGYHDVTEHRDEKLVVVKAGDLHVWYDGTYYTGAGTAETVTEGDVFYYPRGLSGDQSPVVTTVTDIKETDEDRELAVFDIGWEIALGFIRGEPMTRAQLPPPTLLKEQHRY